MDRKKGAKRETKYFGTDGFRGEFGRELLPKHAFLVGRFLGWYFGERLGFSGRILIGRDTRESSFILESELARGITLSGADAYLLGVSTTPATSYLCEAGGFDAAVMITASHNPHRDNGIKVLGCHGEKLDEETTALLEDYIDGDLAALGIKVRELPTEKSGRAIDHSSAKEDYMRHLSLAAGSLSGLKIGLDCANGAAYKMAPEVFRSLGAEVREIGCRPDGRNINLGVGSTHIDALQDLVKSEGLDMGFAFDGDGDRCIAVDASGEVIDGDREMLILAKALKDAGELFSDTLVTTVMSNKGLAEALKESGILTEVTPVGDRFVFEKMMSEGYTLGGEQSGHIIIRKYASTGDGILTAICLASLSAEKGQGLLALSEGFTPFPQVTENIAVTDKDRMMIDQRLIALHKNTAEEIGNEGRILLRKSGTENLIRVMIEHKNPDKCKHYVVKIADFIREIEKSYE
ncbi:MAG: phosphoglucosamine mutase [Clostridia bacterium]|nr:phosphoglucosamine mutase [Clostridia bacterium]